MVISVLTDNNNRATADVKSVVGKRNGKMAESGSVYVLSVSVIFFWHEQLFSSMLDTNFLVVLA